MQGVSSDVGGEVACAAFGRLDGSTVDVSESGALGVLLEDARRERRSASGENVTMEALGRAVVEDRHEVIGGESGTPEVVSQPLPSRVGGGEVERDDRGVRDREQVNVEVLPEGVEEAVLDCLTLLLSKGDPAGRTRPTLAPLTSPWRRARWRRSTE